MNALLVEFLKPLVQYLLENIEGENYGTVYFTVGLCCVVTIVFGYFVAWLQGKRKLEKEIEKLGMEAKEKRMTLLEKVHEKRREYIKDTELIQMSVKLCIDAMVRRDIDSLKSNREELIDYYFNVLVDIYTRYIEVCEVLYEGNRAKTVACIQDEVFPFFETTAQFMLVVNNDNIIDLVQQKKVKLKEYTLNPVLRYAKNNIRNYQLILIIKYYNERRKIKQYFSA